MSELSITRTKEINAKRLALLHPVVLGMVEEFVLRCQLELGLTVLITSTLRTFDEQTKLYARGRYGQYASKSKVTNAKAGQSYHNYGLAADYIPLKDLGTGQFELTWNDEKFLGPAFNACRALAKKMGFELISWDRPHLQFTGGWSHRELFTAGYGTKKSVYDIPLKTSEDDDEKDLPVTV